jgi:REP element-mobilizing transposase RayT
MARPLRIEYPGAWYHVMNRGRRGEEIFSDKKDYEAFVVLLRETGEMFDFHVSAYCLMSNHYQLLVRTPSGVLSRVNGSKKSSTCKSSMKRYPVLGNSLRQSWLLIRQYANFNKIMIRF